MFQDNKINTAYHRRGICWSGKYPKINLTPPSRNLGCKIEGKRWRGKDNAGQRKLSKTKESGRSALSTKSAADDNKRLDEKEISEV